MNLSQTGFDLLSLLQPTTGAPSTAAGSGDGEFGQLFQLKTAGLAFAADGDQALPLATEVAADSARLQTLPNGSMTANEMLGQIAAQGDLSQMPEAEVATVESLTQTDTEDGLESFVTLDGSLGDDHQIVPLKGDEVAPLQQTLSTADDVTDDDSDLDETLAAAVAGLNVIQLDVDSKPQPEQTVIDTTRQTQFSPLASPLTSMAKPIVSQSVSSTSDATDMTASVDEEAVATAIIPTEEESVSADTPDLIMSAKPPKSEAVNLASNTSSAATTAEAASNSEETESVTVAEQVEEQQQDMLLDGERQIADEMLEFGSDRDKWGATLGSRLVTMVANDIQEARIQLDPPELGAMEIQMSVDKDDQARVQIQVQNPQVREVLENQAQKLRDALGQQGLTLSGFDVSDQAAQQFAGQGGSGDGQSNTGDQMQSSDGTLTLDQQDAESVVTSQSDHLVSTYA